MIVRTGRLLLATLLAAAVAAGCASPAPAPAAPAPAAPAPADGAPVAVDLPWPARSDAEADGLQQAVDGGLQPWLLDPAEVALSYVATAHGWTTADTTVDDPTPDGAATVTVTGPDGARRLGLGQPATTGATGIWVVESDTPA